MSQPASLPACPLLLCATVLLWRANDRRPPLHRSLLPSICSPQCTFTHILNLPILLQLLLLSLYVYVCLMLMQGDGGEIPGDQRGSGADLLGTQVGQMDRCSAAPLTYSGPSHARTTHRMIGPACPPMPLLHTHAYKHPLKNSHISSLELLD